MASGEILSPEASEKIARAVAAAEEKSGGEIVTAVIAESDDYGFRELLAAVITGFLAINLTAFLLPSIESYLSTRFWGMQSGILTFLPGMAGLVAGGIAYFLTQIPAIDRLIIPASVMEEAVRRRANRHFMESGAYDTLDQTGVLIFVSILERRVELIADRGINARVEADTWNEIVASLSAGISRGELVESLVKAVEDCGDILCRHIERRQNDTNELDDRPEELGKGS
jgi:putative membrane protein